MDIIPDENLVYVPKSRSTTIADLLDTGYNIESSIRLRVDKGMLTTFTVMRKTREIKHHKEDCLYDLRRIDIPLLIKQRKVLGKMMVNSKELTEKEKTLLDGLWELLHDIQDVSEGIQRD